MKSLLFSLLMTPALLAQDSDSKQDAFEVLETARVEAAESGRNLFVHIGAAW